MNSAQLSGRGGRWVRMRMGLLCGFLAVGLGVLVATSYQLMASDGKAWRELAEQQRQRRLHVVPKRGTIYDRNGSALAITVEVPSVSLDAVELLRGVPGRDVPGVAREAANAIAEALGLDPAVVERRILEKRRFAWLKRRISEGEAVAIRALSSTESAGRRRVRGLLVEGEGQRFYPRRALGGPLLGFVAPDGEGKDGLELGLDDNLKGHVELLRGLRDRSGRLLLADGIQDERALAGHDVQLTIDQGIQFVAERELEAAVRIFEASGGSVIVVDPFTGELLALANWPGYNPNDYRTSAVEQRRNRSVSDTYEPGSSVKIFTLAVGLAHGAIAPTQRLYCEKGMMQVDNVTIRDTHPSEWLSVADVLAISSNICAAKVGLSLGGAKLYEGFRRFGFGEASGMPVPGEASGTLRPRGRPWVQVETASAAFGQGIGVTNLQMAMGVAALANGGELMEPILVRRVATATGEVVREAVPRVRRRAVSARVARTVAELMVAVTEGEGTGTEAAIEGYRVAGKTATAQKTDPRTGRYSLDDYIASFVGFVPAEKPVVAIAVMVDSPRVDHAGGNVAAPIFRRVGAMALTYYGLLPQGTKPTPVADLAQAPDPAQATYEVLRRSEGKKPPVQEVAGAGAVREGQVRVPDMTGWPAREAVRRAVELGVTPEVQGTGLLSRQVPTPGTVVSKGEKLTLVFEPAT
ncbi:MAG: transpeptidase family protein [Polyangiaceae bacterium]|nr:transpeptidase family protein [Polyangiaceae bacterium]